MRIRKKQGGFIVSAELMLIATILVIGLVVGLQAVRVAVVTELADVGDAIGTISQTYAYSGVAGHHASSNGSFFEDEKDTCDLAVGSQQNSLTSRCVRVCGLGSGTPGAVSEDPAPEDGAPVSFSTN